MGDLKSKLPDLKELASMTGKLFKDIKKSVGEIIDDYRAKHPSECTTEGEEAKPVKKTSAKPRAKKTEKKE